MKKSALIKVLEGLADEGVPVKTYLRNLKIRHEYEKEISNNPEINKTELKEKLAKRYFLSFKSIEGILKNE